MLPNAIIGASSFCLYEAFLMERFCPTLTLNISLNISLLTLIYLFYLKTTCTVFVKHMSIIPPVCILLYVTDLLIINEERPPVPKNHCPRQGQC